MDPIVSVIVPVYNVEKYLPECLDSILSQTFSSLDIVLVDDGSTDDSADICDEYAAQDGRIRVFHQGNQGQSAARNLGLSKARGEYCLCVDGDDVVSEIYVEALYRALVDSKCSVAAMRSGVQFQDSDRPDLEIDINAASTYTIVSEVDYQEEILYQKSNEGPCWRICKTEIANMCKYPTGLVYEALLTTYRVLHHCGNIAILNCSSLYGYRQRAGSTMKRKCSDLNVRSCLKVTDQLYHDIAEWYPRLKMAASSRCFSVSRAVYAGLPDEDEGNRALVWNIIRSHAPIVVKDVRARKRERIAATVALMGKRPFSLFCTLYRAYKRTHNN